MATYTVRGTSHNIVYPYRNEKGAKKQQWETYETELEAAQRKTYIDYLQKHKMRDEILNAALAYKAKRAAEKEAAQRAAGYESITPEVPNPPAGADNTDKTYREFAEIWLPFHARKKRFSPHSFDSYRDNLDTHILPYFGERVMSSITSEDIDNFLDSLSQKPCKGFKSNQQNPEDIPTLASSAIYKCYTILMAGFSTAKKWRYITEIPETTAPSVKTNKRRA